LVTIDLKFLAFFWRLLPINHNQRLLFQGRIGSWAVLIEPAQKESGGAEAPPP
jgi:hypothetical protein